ncbi:YraN family protein [Pectinatus sottacetonis]|uniref:YraN family protein n=1 Tax=Pectinatus sottacetonis TaxID=1002795 RepID=UPI0018C4D665|nr:YraN family protein [Pectinatus sottacetonis]
MDKKKIGSLGEKCAADFLQKQGYKILNMNFFSKYGEIDIIAKKGSFLIFVEVKTRKNTFFGTAAQAVDIKKQRKIIHTAEFYILLHQNLPVNYRFDIIEIYYKQFTCYKVNHIKGAFEI